jgi:RNA polymerase sigma factor (sigma-70 family)
MSQASEADRYLLDAIARGDTGAWSQLVNRYHGRLLAFARSRTKPGDAEDFVQETFLLFLQSFRAFRQDASLETYLFTILRRRMIDHFRGKKLATCAIGDSSGPEQVVVDDSHTPSWYMRRDEQTELLEQAVAAGLDGMLEKLRDEAKLREIRAIELLFYAQMRNKDIAAALGMDEKQVGLLKFRTLQQIRDRVAQGLDARRRQALEQFRWEDSGAADSLLTRVWEKIRPTCPKRSTIGRLVLGTLESPWREHVEFHLDQLGCRFCLANLEDLKRETAAEAAPVREKIFQSTVGFLTRV